MLELALKLTYQQRQKGHTEIQH